MWGNSLIIDHLIPPASPGDLQGKEEDKLVLSWEQRRWMRGRFTTLNGRKIGVALPTGTTLVFEGGSRNRSGARSYSLGIRGSNKNRI
jgi:urease accessory protein UreE